MTQEQRKLFARGFVELANLTAAALIFGQLIAGRDIDLSAMALGIIFTLTFYFGAYRFSKVGIGSDK